MSENSIRVPNELLLSEIGRLLAQGKRCSLRTKGSSMLPFIRGERDSVVLEALPEILAGDIVLAKVPGRGYVLHRVMRIEGERLFLMGDGNLRYGEECSLCDVLGSVVWIEKDCGGGLKLPKNPEDQEVFRRAHPRIFVDPRSPGQLRKARLWRRLKPFRRLILAVYRKTLLAVGNGELN